MLRLNDFMIANRNLTGVSRVRRHDQHGLKIAPRDLADCSGLKALCESADDNRGNRNEGRMSILQVEQ